MAKNIRGKEVGGGTNSDAFRSQPALARPIFINLDVKWLKETVFILFYNELFMPLTKYFTPGRVLFLNMATQFLWVHLRVH